MHCICFRQGAQRDCKLHGDNNQYLLDSSGYFDNYMYSDQLEACIHGTKQKGE